MIEIHYSQFFKMASRLLKYFFIAAFSFAIALVLSKTLGVSHITEILLSKMGPFLFRSAIVVACVMTTATIFESLRQ